MTTKALAVVTVLSGLSIGSLLLASPSGDAGTSGGQGTGQDGPRKLDPPGELPAAEASKDWPTKHKADLRAIVVTLSSEKVAAALDDRIKKKNIQQQIDDIAAYIHLLARDAATRPSQEAGTPTVEGRN